MFCKVNEKLRDVSKGYFKYFNIVTIISILNVLILLMDLRCKLKKNNIDRKQKTLFLNGISFHTKKYSCMKINIYTYLCFIM